MIADFHKKGNKTAHRNFLAKVGLVALLLVVAVVALADVKIYRKKRELDSQVAALQRRIEQLKTQNTSLQDGLARADDDVYIEKVAREELDLQMPGEKVFSFVAPQNQPVAPAHNDGWAAAGNWWHSFISIFKK